MHPLDMNILSSTVDVAVMHGTNSETFNGAYSAVEMYIADPRYASQRAELEKLKERMDTAKADA
jgi:hypothetical protein